MKKDIIKKNYIKKTWEKVEKRLDEPVFKKGRRTMTRGGRGGSINQQRAIKDLVKLT